MAITLREFQDKYLGKQVEYHSFGTGAQNQCTDLVNQYIKEVLNKTPIIGTNAKDFGKNYNKNEFDWIVNTTEAIIESGDIPVWNGNVGGGAGHVAIATRKGTQNSFISVDQNWSISERVTLENHSYNNVIGWLRPKGGVVMNNDIDAVRKERDFNWNGWQACKKELDEVRKARDENWNQLVKTKEELRVERAKSKEVDPVADAAKKALKEWLK